MIRQRVISAVVIAVLLIGVVLWLPTWWSAAALSLVLAAAAWEWSAFVATSPAGRGGFLAATIAACALWWLMSASADGLKLTLWMALLFWSAMLLWVFSSPHASRRAVFVTGILALSFAWCALVRMRVDLSWGRYAVMYALLIVWLADSGAYFAGRTWGVRKLAPSVSPGKTWAGLWGGLVVCAVLAVLVARLRHVPLAPLVVVTLMVAIYSVVGDLVESLCKRFAGIKDSGTLIPGHGGVLDRFDSLLAAAPCLMLGIKLSGIAWS